MSEALSTAPRAPELQIVEGGAIRPAKPSFGRRSMAVDAANADIENTPAPKAKRERKKQPRSEAGNRAMIVLAPGELAAQVDQCQQALVDGDAGVYQRAGKIVQIGRSLTKNFKGEDVHGQAVVTTGEHALRERISTVAQFEKFDGRSGDYVLTDCPMDLPRTLMQRASLGLPPLTGFVNQPTLRNDGSILEVEGYDTRTGILYDACGVEFPAIPEAPTYQDAAGAMDRFAHLLSGFPFVLAKGETPEKNANLSVALSALLSSVIRRSIDNCPMHGFSAPVRGSGKSTLVDLAAIMTSGSDAACTSTGPDEVELEKRLSSLYLAGKAVIAIDNVSMPLGGDFLNIALSQALVTPRILGKSETPTINTTALVCATGNNLRVRADMPRRVLLCVLDPQMARPELRRFAFDPKEEMKAHRADYVLDALTILRAWQVAGRPEYCSPLLDYTQWGWVRNALMWLHHADPCNTMEAAAASDPELEELTTVVTQWDEVFQGDRVSCRTVIERAQSTVGGGYASDPKHPDLREALNAVCAAGSTLSTKRLGKWLKANAMRVVEGRRFEQVGKIDGIETWSLVVVPEK